MDNYHIPVMLHETITYLVQDSSGTYIDCTLGGGGHSEEILKRLNTDGVLYSIDQDDEALSHAGNRLKGDARIHFCKGNFSSMYHLTTKEKNSVDGILMDLGVSSHQIDAVERGFSFQADFPLDMRMNQEDEKTAEDIVNDYSINDLKRIFFNYGEEKFANRIANGIINARTKKPIKTTFELKNIIEASIPKGPKMTKSFARIFQALRIEVNNEMNVLEQAIDQAYDLLKNNGRLVVLSYHSLEDRIIKRFIKSKKKSFYNPDRPMEYHEADTYFISLSSKPMLPSENEIELNPRARSAKLRVAEKKVKEVA